MQIPTSDVGRFIGQLTGGAYPTDKTTVPLFCGATPQDDSTPRTEQALDLAYDGPLFPLHKRPWSSNGCGVQIHMGAIAGRVWRGGEGGVVKSVVIALEEQYFTPEMRSELQFGVHVCGCKRSGVGCAVCGNALGSVFVRCTAHTVTPSAASAVHGGQYQCVFLPSAVSPPLPSATTSGC
ncbi:hypothetical protein B0H10DRAFT_2015106 [Mycena sp. CBHHK59/15]|nr:hypothetical protein B0H10DRAFT_2015106 [Mycena sp. CBHHK59/15]